MGLYGVLVKGIQACLQLFDIGNRGMCPHGRGRRNRREYQRQSKAVGQQGLTTTFELLSSLKPFSIQPTCW